jgi:hypothetical protein
MTNASNEYLQRLEVREIAIHEWLKKNSLSQLSRQSNDLLSSLDRNLILQEFTDGMNTGIEACLEVSTIKGLDFSWYFDGDEPDAAYAYAFDSVRKTASLSNTDLGDPSLPGIECDLKYDKMVNQDFADLPVYHSINLYVEHLQNDLDESVEVNPHDTDSLVLNLFEIWNYKLAIEAIRKLSNESQKALSTRSFWITMTRHERWPVAIASF